MSFSSAGKVETVNCGDCGRVLCVITSDSATIEKASFSCEGCGMTLTLENLKLNGLELEEY